MGEVKGRCREVCWGVGEVREDVGRGVEEGVGESVGECVGEWREVNKGKSGKMCGGGAKKCIGWVWEMQVGVWESVLGCKESEGKWRKCGDLCIPA